MYEPFYEPRNDVAAVALSASEKRQLRALAERRHSSVSSYIHSLLERELAPDREVASLPARELGVKSGSRR